MITALIVLLVLLLFPFVTYVTVKAGTYAFYMGREAFFNQHGRRDDEK